MHGCFVCDCPLLSTGTHFWRNQEIFKARKPVPQNLWQVCQFLQGLPPPHEANEKQPLWFGNGPVFAMTRKLARPWSQFSGKWGDLKRKFTQTLKQGNLLLHLLLASVRLKRIYAERNVLHLLTLAEGRQPWLKQGYFWAIIQMLSRQKEVLPFWFFF